MSGHDLSGPRGRVEETRDGPFPRAARRREISGARVGEALVAVGNRGGPSASAVVLRAEVAGGRALEALPCRGRPHLLQAATSGSSARRRWHLREPPSRSRRTRRQRPTCRFDAHADRPSSAARCPLLRAEIPGPRGGIRRGSRAEEEGGARHEAFAVRRRSRGVVPRSVRCAAMPDRVRDRGAARAPRAREPRRVDAIQSSTSAELTRRDRVTPRRPGRSRISPPSRPPLPRLRDGGQLVPGDGVITASVAWRAPDGRLRP